MKTRPPNTYRVELLTINSGQGTCYVRNCTAWGRRHLSFEARGVACTVCDNDAHIMPAAIDLVRRSIRSTTQRMRVELVKSRIVREETVLQTSDEIDLEQLRAADDARLDAILRGDHLRAASA